MARRKHPQRTGRPTTLGNDTIREALLNHIAAGVHITHAAPLAGVGTSTLMSWLAKGRDARERRTTGRPPEVNDHLYADFLDQMERARARAGAGAIATVQKAARGGNVTKVRTYTDEGGNTVTETTYSDVDWRAAAWLLERSFKEQFGKSMYVDVTTALNLTLGIPDAVLDGNRAGAGPGQELGSTGHEAIARLAQQLRDARESAPDVPDDMDEWDGTEVMEGELVEDRDD